MVRNGVIDKVAWIRIEGKRVLCARSRGKELFYLPGGKREAGESDAECLEREIREELDVTIRRESIEAAGVFVAQADGKPEGTTVRMACYRADFEGTLRANAEIEELAWLTHADRARGSHVTQLILDALHQRGELE